MRRPCAETPWLKATVIEKTARNILADGKAIGGKGQLTDKRIDKLQVYYGKAIRQNTHDIECMQNAVMAIWHHSKSTDENPDHDLCPPGEQSLCGFQRDISKGTADYVHKSPIPEAVADAIYPTFEALSDESLLSECLHGTPKIKPRLSMDSFGNGQPRKHMPVHQL